MTYSLDTVKTINHSAKYPMEDNMEYIVQLFKSFSDPGRIRAFMAIAHAGELCLCDVTNLLGFSAPTVSRHMKILVNTGVITAVKRGKWVYYSVNPTLNDIAPLIAWLKIQLEKNQQIKEDRKTISVCTSCKLS